MQDFETMMRRIVTADDADGKSAVVVDGGPSAEALQPGLGGLFEIWAEGLGDVLDPSMVEDKGPDVALLPPGDDGIKIRWFVMEPTPEGIPAEALRAAAKATFTRIGAGDHVIDQSRHPGMHETDTIDVICLLKGRANLILEATETELRPGNVVIQRGTNHAWAAVDGPALFLAILIGRKRI